ncbi:MAG: phosphomannomutase/phosphoglucomutase, partial [Anaerolineae bacterium]|nr:phosphomannomutase/phosphoglucomutase [Anaerolineae bacterium]
MTKVNPHIFRKYDIRGLVTGDNPDLTPPFAHLVGQAYGTYMQREHGIERVHVGSDNRASSPALRQAIIEGVASTGLDVTDIGEVLTPTVYFATAAHGFKSGGIMITGSHLTTDFNGIKMAHGKLALYGDQIQTLLKLIQADDFEHGEGTITQAPDMITHHMNTVKGKVKLGVRKLKVVVDAGNGLSGTYVPPIMEALGVEVVCLYCEPDGSFPNHLPNPENPELTKDLEAAVIKNKADLGIGFDGDSDRCGVIDDHGHHVAADRLLALLAKDLLKRHPGAKIVFDVKSSLALDDVIRQNGGVPVMWQAGHSLMKAKMNEIGSLLGGEVSGHTFIGEDYYGFDDAPLVALKVLEILSKTDRSISDLLGEFPKLVATPEIIMSTPDEVKFQIIDAARDQLQEQY